MLFRSLVASVRNGVAECLPDAQGRVILPSVVRYLDGNRRQIGFDARAAQADDTQHAALRIAAAKSCAVHVQAMLDFQAFGIPTVDYGNNIRQVALDQGVANAFDFPGFVPAYVRPLFCRGKGPFRWVALSVDPEDIRKTDAKMKELFPEDAHLHRWLDMAGERIAFQGLPARICWLGLGERHLAGLVAVGGAAYGAYWALVLNHFETTDNAYVQANVVQVTPQIGGTVLAINGGGAGRFFRIFDGRNIEAAWFGCVVSLSDQSTAINNAIAACGALGGGYVWLPHAADART